MIFRYQVGLVFVSIFSLLSINIVGLPKEAIASIKPQAIQIAQALTQKQDNIKTRLISILDQLIKIEIPLSEQQKTKLDSEANLIDDSISKE